MNGTEHDVLRESAGLYVLGALDDRERRAFEDHMRTCAACQAEVRVLGGAASTLPFAVTQVDPSPALRQRVLEDIRPARLSVPPVTPAPARPLSTSSSWLAMAALLALIAALGGYAFNLRQRLTMLQTQMTDAMTRLQRSERQLVAATELAQSAQVRMAVLTAPDLRQMTLAGRPIAPRASGRAFWSPSTGLVFAAADLPPLPPGRTYQLWLLRPAPDESRPVSAGLIRPDAAGRVAAAFDAPPDVPAPSGVAVSIEPEGGVPAPTGELYLVGRAQ